MSLSLTNRDDIIANSFSLITSTGLVVDVLDAATSRVSGLAPETLNTITKISTALDNDPLIFQKIQAKQQKITYGTTITGSQSLLSSTTAKLKNIVAGTNLAFSTTDDNITLNVDGYDKANLDGKFTNKQDKFITTSPLSFITPTSNILTLKCDAYTTKEIDDKFTNLIDAAPSLLNTLGEISRFLGNPTDTTTSLISTIALKAAINDTFLKSKIDNDVYLGGLGNKRITSLGTTENKIIFEIQDSMGTAPSNLFNQALTLQMNIATKKISCYIPDFLFVNNLNVIDELGKKVNTTDLDTYALASSLATYLKLDFNQLLVPKIVLTDTFAGPPITGTNSLGSRLVLYNLQSTNTSYTNIGIGVDAGSWMWFGVDGATTASPFNLGGWRFYQNTNIVATIKSNGDFICRNITCDGLTIGTTDILTALNNKLTNDTTQSIICNVLTAKSSVIKDSKPYAHVSNTISNNGTGGFASVFVSSLNSSNIVQHSMGLKIGNTTGGYFTDCNQHAIKIPYI